MFLLLTDDATRFTTIYLLKHIDEAIEHIMRYDQKILIKTGKHLSIFRSDGGGEFFNNSLKEYFDLKQITYSQMSFSTTR